MAAEPGPVPSADLIPPRPPERSQTNRNLWLAFTEEAKANRLYVAYALKAMEEGHPEVAEVFLEISGAETIHALEHLRVLGEVSTTYENLQRVIEEEMREASVMYPRMMRQAEAEGRRDAIKAFRLAFEGEGRHARLLQNAFDKLHGHAAQGTAPLAQAPQPVVAEVPRDSAAAENAVTYDDVQSEKRRVAGLRRIREVVFGAQDGLISTVAISATVMAATRDARVAILAGLASAAAGTVSMAAGTYLGSRASTEMEESELDMEQREILMHPDEEHAELVATFRHDGYGFDEAEAMADRLMTDRQLALQVMAERELGITPEAPADPRKDAVAMGISYMLGSLLPLSAYFLLRDLAAIPLSMVVTLAALAVVGVAKARTAHNPVLPSVLEVTGIGAVSGILGYLLGDIVPHLLGSS